MQKLVFGALVVGLFAACGGGSTKVIEANLGSGGTVCDPIAQRAARTGRRRAARGSDTDWSVTSAALPRHGRVGAASSFTPLGSAARTFPCPPRPTTTTARPARTASSAARAIRPRSVAPARRFAITTPAPRRAQRLLCGLRRPVRGQRRDEAGVCEKECDPLTDNYFGSGVRADPGEARDCGPDRGLLRLPDRVRRRLPTVHLRRRAVGTTTSSIAARA